MLKKLLLSAFYIIFFAGVSCAAGMERGLATLEGMVGSGPEVLEAMQILARDEYLVEQEKFKSSPTAFFGVSVGHYDEPPDRAENYREAYENYRVVAGITFPLLGSWSAHKIAVLRASINAAGSRAGVQLTKLRNLTALRKAYALYWAEGRKIPLLKAFLANETETRTFFTKQRDGGYLLETDRLEFISAFDNARRMLALANHRRLGAANVIALAVGRNFDNHSAVPEPELPKITSLQFASGAHPDVAMKRDILALSRKILESSRNVNTESQLDIGAYYTLDNPGVYGLGTYASWTIREPFGSHKYRHDSTLRAASADVKRAELSLEMARTRLESELSELISQREYAEEALTFAIRRVESACEAIRMMELRYDKLSGDTFERMQQSRSDYLITAMQLIDAELFIIQNEIDLFAILFPTDAPGIGQREPLIPSDQIRRDILFNAAWLRIGERKPELSAGELRISIDSKGGVYGMNTADSFRFSAYVWDAEPFLDTEGCERNMSALRDAGFERILLSFNAKQLKYLRTARGREAFLRAIDKGTQYGITVELLLGDPAWGLPDGRPSLISLLKFFRDHYPMIAGVHLDIEPDSLKLPVKRRPELLRELMATMEAAKNVVDCPLGMSIHPRYLEGEFVPIIKPALEKLDLEVAVMIYSTNAENVKKRFGNIKAAFPNVRFTLAQSTEKALDNTESWYSKVSREHFRRYMSPYRSVLVQAWEDYQHMTDNIDDEE